MGNRWDGQTVVCIASGPSLTAQDCETVRIAQSEGRCKVVTCNTSYQAAPFADILYAGDFTWWSHYTRQVKAGKWKPFDSEKWTISRSAAHRFGLELISGFQGPGLSKQPGRIHLGGNSGYAQIGLALDWGSPRVLLLGYDMQRTGNRTHHHGDHPRPLGNANAFPTWLRRFDVMAKDARKMGLEIVNCSRASALTCFPRMTIEQALECVSP